MGIWHIFEIKGGGGGRYNGTKGGGRFRNEGVLTILFTNYEAT